MKISQIADLVRDIPLDDVLIAYGFEVRREGSTFRSKTENHNIVITGSKWFDNKAGVGGGDAIDLVIHLKGVGFPEACQSLADQFSIRIASEAGIAFPNGPARQPETERKTFDQLRATYAVEDERNWPIARAYLIGQRMIPAQLVHKLHEEGLIYANDHRPNPSLVFLHKNRHGKVEGATLRDTRHDSPFRPTLGNKLTAWFCVGHLAHAETVAVVESPIDALSYYSMKSNGPFNVAVVSCAGASVPAELMLLAELRGQPFVVALDRDGAGELGWERAQEETADWQGFKISCDTPRGKDWNEDLIQERQRQVERKIQQISSLKL